MADDPTPGQEPTPAEGQTPPASPPSPSPKDDGPEPKPTETFDRTYVEELRREAAKHRKEKEAAEARLKALDDEKLSEQERQARELAETKATLEQERKARQSLVVAHALEREAAAQGFIRADDAARYVDLASVELDADGQPVNIKRLVESVLKDRPHLKAAAGPAGIPATPRPSNGELSDAERAKQAAGIKSFW